MPLDKPQRTIAAIALRAGRRHGLALGGAGALIEHGIIHRPTQDLDLVTNRETGVADAAGPVQAALHEAGLETVRRGDSLTDLFPGFAETLIDLDVTAPDGQQTAVELVYFDRALNTVTTDIGPVLHVEDALGSKVCALAGRAAERDYMDTAAALARGYTPGQLIAFARRVDPGLSSREFAEAGRQLGQLPDQQFTEAGFTPRQVTQMREQFTIWPRDAETVDRELDAHRGEERTARQEQDRGTAEQQNEAPAASAGGDRETEPSQDPPGPGTDIEAESQAAAPMPDLAAKLERGEQAAQRLQEYRAERVEADDQQRAQDQAAAQQHQQERAAEPERGGPEIEP
jgi:Nucleotidyl transferase AbiEii toxin, Type IV TA system